MYIKIILYLKHNLLFFTSKDRKNITSTFSKNKTDRGKKSLTIPTNMTEIQTKTQMLKKTQKK